MTGILGEIVKYKRQYVEDCKQKIPLSDIKMMANEAGDTRNFISALKGPGCSLIAEIKTASPSRGIIRDDVKIEDVARIYEKNGASCISVLTDEKYFMGTLNRLGKVREVTTIPLLRKDFIIDVYQIYEARRAGADAVLLIAACLDDMQLGDFIELSTDLGLDCLVEVHEKTEIERVKNLNARLVGINNRNLNTFETNIDVTGKLAPYAPSNAILVSESGIHSSEDVRKIHGMGAGAVLVGEAIMRARDMAEKTKELSHAVGKV
ncbi:Indole-3-glycerol phosphate synthase [subsurface metagenome]